MVGLDGRHLTVVPDEVRDRGEFASCYEKRPQVERQRVIVQIDCLPEGGSPCKIANVQIERCRQNRVLKRDPFEMAGVTPERT
ncbi:MAG: hypothetical protein EON54_18640 [Alcaligenaceae bacterium]|nr:MAG: hypothetical protein EON54_18640 [Alcaligenaceae bacterium]